MKVRWVLAALWLTGGLLLILLMAGAQAHPQTAEGQQGPPSTLHPIEGREACSQCHSVNGPLKLPADHAGRPDQTCLLCHQQGAAAPAPTATPPPTPTPLPPGATPLPTPTPTPTATPPPTPPAVMHILEGRQNCLGCHNPMAIQPFPRGHAGFGNDACQLCHKAAEFPPPRGGKTLPMGPSVPLQEEQAYCLSCHGDLGLTKTFPDGRTVSLYVNLALRENSSHRYIRCTTCHSSKPHEGNTSLSKQSLAAKCGACHQYEYELHLKSVHGQQLAQGNLDVATCVDCHSPDKTPHSVVRVLEFNAPTYKKNIAGTCGQCHADEKLMARYGIVEKVYESYMRSFHGKAMELTTSFDLMQLNKATCTSCHGTHEIMDPYDPASPVAGMESLARTCEQCHAGAGVEFARGFLGHREASPDYIPAAFYAERFFLLLTTSAVAFGVLVVAVAASSWARRGWREKE